MVTLDFHSTERSSANSVLRVYYNSHNELFIEIEHEEYPPSFICLDKETAIKLAKEVRKQISFIQEDTF